MTAISEQTVSLHTRLLREKLAEDASPYGARGRGALSSGAARGRVLGAGAAGTSTAAGAGAHDLW